MKNKKTEPVQIMLTYNANSAERDNLRVKIAPAIEKENAMIKKLDDNHKLVRRYSFDDNGGSYLGL